MAAMLIETAMTITTMRLLVVDLHTFRGECNPFRFLRGCTSPQTRQEYTALTTYNAVQLCLFRTSP